MGEGVYFRPGPIRFRRVRVQYKPWPVERSTEAWLFPVLTHCRDLSEYGKGRQGREANTQTLGSNRGTPGSKSAFITVKARVRT